MEKLFGPEKSLEHERFKSQREVEKDIGHWNRILKLQKSYPRKALNKFSCMRERKSAGYQFYNLW